MDHAISQKNHQKALQKNISLLTKQICTRYDKRNKISSLFFSRCKDSRFTSVIKSLINIIDALIYDAIRASILKKITNELLRSVLISHSTPTCDSMNFTPSSSPPLTWHVFICILSRMVGGFESDTSRTT